MSFGMWVADSAASVLTRILCRVDGEALRSVPADGPLIVVTNHVNWLEIPVLRAKLRAQKVIALAKAEAWNNAVAGWLLDRWEAIPIHRGENDIQALRKALAALDAGRILGLAPEGTRSGDGCLQRGNPGMTTIALRSGAPILPVAFHGGEAFGENIKRLRRTPFRFAVGPLCRIDTGNERVTRDVRRAITDEVMYELAALLPERYRGAYAGVDDLPRTYLRTMAQPEAS